jgi:CelD/BcsL family acetyltransferase involved in cellulose biosynthesis
MPNEQGWGTLVGGHRIATQHDLVLRFDGMTWEDFVASRSKKFREAVGRRERQLIKEHGLTFRLAEDPDRLPTEMDTLMRLHAARWGGESTGVFAGNGAEFHRRFAADALQRGWLRLWFAELRGEPVAAWYSWRYGGSEWLYQSGRDPRFHRLSLGFALLAHAVREACGDGLEAYHFLSGDAEYKRRFANEDPGCESRLVGSRILTRAGGLAIALRSSLPESARRLVMRTSD